MTKSKFKVGELVKSTSTGRIALVTARPDCGVLGHGVWIQWVSPLYKGTERQWIADCWLEVYNEQK